MACHPPQCPPSAAGCLRALLLGLPLAAGLMVEPPTARRPGGAAVAAATIGARGGDLLQLEAGRRSSAHARANATGAGQPVVPIELVSGGEQVNLTGSLECLENNGGSCSLSSCYSWRGPHQTCHLARCFCTQGTCAGTDGKCHSQQNALLASGVRLRNVRWPGYFMYMSRWNWNIWIGQSPGVDADWEVRQLPGGGYASDPPDFLVTSSRFPGQALRVEESRDCDSHNYCETTYSASASHVTFPMETGIQHLALEFERVPEKPEAVMIAPFQFPRKHLYVGRFTWEVKPYDGDPGTGGYWTFDPPLTNDTMSKLRFYHGPRCTFNCGLGCALAPSRGLLALLLVAALLAPRGGAS